MRDGGDADQYIDTVEKGKEYEFTVDEEMAETAQMYVDYVRRKSEEAGSSPEIEQHFSLSALGPPIEAGGTGDAVLYFPEAKRLEIIDLKGGRGVVVEVKGNPQLRTYALGATLANSGLNVEQITVTIVQPRAGHKDGRIRSETFHVADLIEWTADLLAAMHRAVEAQEKRGQMAEAAWSEEYLHPGDHCKFCKAKPFCPALENMAIDAAGMWFDDQDRPHITNQPDKLSPAELARVLDIAEALEGWVKAVRSNAHKQAEDGAEIPDYVLVEKQGREKWIDSDAEKQVVELATQKGLPEAKYLNPGKLRTPKQVRKEVEKLVSKEAAKKLLAYSVTPVNGTNLVRSDKTSRPVVGSKAERFFDVLS